MKMQKYIRVFLSLILIISNLSVAFSMHFCGGQIEQIKINHLDNKVCKMQMPTSCCADKEEANHCEIPSDKEKEKTDDCCTDLAYTEDIQQQQIVKILKVYPIVFEQYPLVLSSNFPDLKLQIKSKNVLDFYVESNAPPIYILHHQLVVYEA